MMGLQTNRNLSLEASGDFWIPKVKGLWRVVFYYKWVDYKSLEGSNCVYLHLSISNLARPRSQTFSKFVEWMHQSSKSHWSESPNPKAFNDHSFLWTCTILRTGMTYPSTCHVHIPSIRHLACQIHKGRGEDSFFFSIIPTSYHC